MEEEETIGKVSARTVHEVEWEIEDFLSFMEVDEHYASPCFSVSGSEWHLRVYPNGRIWPDSSGYVSLYLFKAKPIDDVGICYSLGVKKVDGSVQWFICNETWVCEKSAAFGSHKFLPRSVLLERDLELMPSSELMTFTCALRTKADFESSESVDNLSRSLTDLFVSQRGCDATLTVKGREFPVHKTILIARSPVFAAMFEADMKERSTGVAEIPDCDPEAFQKFLAYLYSDKIEKVSGGDAVELYKIADKYDVQDLKAYCCLCIMTDLSVENVLDAVLFGDKFSQRGIVLKAQTFFNRHLNPILSRAKWDDFFNEHAALANQLFKSLAKIS